MRRLFRDLANGCYWKLGNSGRWLSIQDYTEAVAAVERSMGHSIVE